MRAVMSAAELDGLSRRGFAVAYRMLGSVADAQDVVQEALLRLSNVEEDLRVPEAWMTTVTTRLSIDHLRRAHVRREAYVGPWLPDPLVGDESPGPEARAELADSLSQAFLVVLEQLTPVERAAFLLREVFGYDYQRVADILGRTEVSCRQLVTRARKHLGANRPRFDADEAARDTLLVHFLAAAENGDLGALERLLAADAVLYSDGGGKVTAARRPIVGAARIAQFLVTNAGRRRHQGVFETEIVRANGQPGRLLRRSGAPVSDVLSIDVVEGRIQAVRIVRNPDKLAHLAGT